VRRAETCNITDGRNKKLRSTEIESAILQPVNAVEGKMFVLLITRKQQIAQRECIIF
jgi:hypothetical protein